MQFMIRNINRKSDMLSTRLWLFVILTSATSFHTSPQVNAEAPVYSRYVFPGENGRMIYEPYTDQGDVIPDFSNCGYMGGGVALAQVPVKMTLNPTEGDDDDRDRIQNAINAVAAMEPDQHGFRGAVLLRRGTYHVGGTLNIHTSGVVLRGQGDGEDGTILIASRHAKYTLIWLAGRGGREIDESTRQTIKDRYVPVGSRTFTLDKPDAFTVGDTVLVCRHGNAKWIEHIGMVPIGWGPFTLQFRRVVTAVDDNRITVDAPIVNAMQEEFGGGSIVRYEVPNHIENCGVENIRTVSVYKHPTDHAHAWRAIRIDKAMNCWVRDVVAQHFAYACVQIGHDAKWITVMNCQCIDMISRIKGGLRYPFALSGQLCLFYNCYATHGRHDFVMHAWVAGPNAFVDCRSEQTYSDSGPHHRYATGTLYDNVETARLNSQNRGHSGSGHGWAGAQTLMWNCTAGSIDVQQPPTAQNFAIGGTVGRPGTTGLLDQVNHRLTPRSLYFAQLQDRLGHEAVMAVQRFHKPLQSQDQTVTCHEGQSIEFQVVMADSDRFPGPPHATIVKQPRQGQAVVHDPRTIIYTSKPGSITDDTFTYQAIEQQRHYTYVKPLGGTNASERVASQPATVTVRIVPDTRSPMLLEAFTRPGSSTIYANFDEPVWIERDQQPVTTASILGGKDPFHPAIKPGGIGRQIVLSAPSIALTHQDIVDITNMRDRAAAVNIGGGRARIIMLKPGVSYRYFQGAANRFIDFEELPAVASGVLDQLIIINPDQREGFSLQLTGWLLISEPGLYQFETTSDDGSRLIVNEQLVVDNGGLHATQTRRGEVHLEPGLHAIRVDYFDGGGEAVLDVKWQPPGADGPVAIPHEKLFTLPS